MNESIINPNYDLLPGSYLFSTIAKKIKEYQGTHENADIIRLGIGDVTTPLIPEVIKAMHKAVDEMAEKGTFRGYGPEQGYDFVRQAIVAGEYTSRGIEMDPDDIFVTVINGTVHSGPEIIETKQSARFHLATDVQTR